jgi:alpha-galactosidase
MTTGSVQMADATKFCVEATRGGNLETWWAPLSGGRHALALFNRSPSADVIAVSWKQLPGLQPATRVLVRDVWSKRDAGIHQDGFSITVPAHGTSLFVLTPVPAGGL